VPTILQIAINQYNVLQIVLHTEILITLVLESLVWSGFFGPEGLDQDKDQSILVLELKKYLTGPQKTRDHSLSQFLNQLWSALVITDLRPVFQPNTQNNFKL